MSIEGQKIEETPAAPEPKYTRAKLRAEKMLTEMTAMDFGVAAQ